MGKLRWVQDRRPTKDKKSDFTKPFSKNGARLGETAEQAVIVHPSYPPRELA